MRRSFEELLGGAPWGELSGGSPWLGSLERAPWRSSVWGAPRRIWRSLKDTLDRIPWRTCWRSSLGASLHSARSVPDSGLPSWLTMVHGLGRHRLLQLYACLWPMPLCTIWCKAGPSRTGPSSCSAPHGVLRLLISFFSFSSLMMISACLGSASYSMPSSVLCTRLVSTPRGLAVFLSWAYRPF